MARTRTSRSSQFGPQIEAESKLRFQPQFDALAMLLKQAVRDRTAALDAAETVRSGLIAGAQAAGPQAQGSLGAASDYLNRALQGVPVPEGLAGSDVAATRARLADQSARTGTELAGRSSDAAAGYAGAVRQAESQYAQDKSKIADELNSLSGQEGTYGASRLAELLAEDRKMRHDTNQQKRQQDFTAGENRKNRAVTKRGQTLSHEDRVAARKDKGKTLPGGAKPVTAAQQGSFEDDVQAAIVTAQRLAKAGRSRHEVAQTMLAGRPGQQVTDPKSGQTVNVPGVPKTGSLITSIALDSVFDKHISSNNVTRAHKRGYKVNSLGIPTKPPATAPRVPRLTPSSSVPVIGGLTARP